jgi:hypothetical protein
MSPRVPADLDLAIQERREAAVHAIHKMLQTYTVDHPDSPDGLREFVRHQQTVATSIRRWRKLVDVHRLDHRLHARPQAAT